MNELQMHRPLMPGARLHTGLTYSEGAGVDATDVPCFYWSNGQYCFEVNSYILHVWTNEKASVDNNGGSLRQYCMQVSHLIRFLEKNRLNFLTLTDTYFTIFINGLSAQVTEFDENVRTNTTVRSIGSRCLDLLSHCTTFYGYPNFVSKDGVVRGYRVEAYMRAERPSEYRRIVWYHHSFPLSSEDRRRGPITPGAINALRAAARRQAPTIAARSKILISILVHTGCRRAEAAGILVQDVMRAYRSKLSHPLVRIPSAKGDKKKRYVPVPHIVLQTWVDYIEEVRSVMISDVMSKPQYAGFVDHDVLLINAVNGAPLSVNTITNEINDLKKAAGILERSHPHMFRHRFITEKFKELIIQYDLQNTDVMRRAIANADVIKRVLQEWSGHKLTESLDRYIHLAFNELARMEHVVSDVFADASVKALDTILDEFEQEWKAGLISAQEQEERSTRAVKSYLSSRMGR